LGDAVTWASFPPCDCITKLALQEYVHGVLLRHWREIKGGVLLQYWQMRASPGPKLEFCFLGLVFELAGMDLKKTLK
jgi:hypothetical protein